MKRSVTQSISRNVTLCGTLRWTTFPGKNVALLKFPEMSLFQRKSVTKYLKKIVKLNMKSMIKSVTLDISARLCIRYSHREKRYRGAIPS